MKTSLKTLALTSLGVLTLTACSVKLPSVEELLSKDKASTTVSSQSSSASSTPASSAAVATISQEDAIKAALDQLGLTQDQVSNLVIEPSTEGNKAVYDVSFTFEEMDYEYTIDGETGQPVEQESEQTDAAEETSEASAINLSADDAKAVAIEDFASVYGVGEESLSNLAVEQSTDGYDISFVYEGMTFDYEIDANTGAIIGFSEGDLD